MGLIDLIRGVASTDKQDKVEVEKATRPKVKFNRLPSDVARILVDAKIDTSKPLPSRKYINSNSYSVKKYLELEIDPEKLNDDILRNIASLIIRKHGEPEFLRKALGLRPETASNLVLVILNELSVTPDLYTQFLKNHIEGLQAIYPGFFDSDSTI